MARPKTHLAVARHMRLITAYDGPRGLLFTVRMQHVAVINLMCVATNLICGNKLTSTLEMSIELWSEIKYTLKCKNKKASLDDDVCSPTPCVKPKAVDT